MDLGFIGLGNMGLPMARRLVEAGHRLVVFDTRKEALDRLASFGAEPAASVRDMADRVETVIASLPTPQIVHEVATGEGGVIEGKRVRRFADLSTTGCVMAARIAQTLAARKIVQIDSPVSGGVGGAQKGTLAVMVSGPRSEVEAVRPALEVIGRVFFIGEKPGQAQTMKLVNNILSATAMAATSEAMVLAAKAGLDPAVALAVINAGSGQNTASRDKFPKEVLTGSFAYGFTTGLMTKDVRLCLQEAEALGVPMDVMRAVGRVWAIAMDEIGPDHDFTTVIQPLEKRAGVAVRALDEAGERKKGAA